jgi:hypothetical protein
MTRCIFDTPWYGQCRNDTPCKDHKNAKCWKCEAPATKACGWMGQFMCGRPSCDKHPHENTRHG